MRFVPFVVATFLLLPLVAQATGTAAIIQVAAYEASNHEWIDVQNNGDQPLDLTGWKFWEDNVNHGLAAFRGGLVLGPGETGRIADVAATTATDHPEWTGILIDSSWDTLAPDGEPIGLRDPAGTLMQFPDARWLKDAPTPNEPTPDTLPATPSTAPTTGDLVLSEFLPAPSDGNEWIELHNTSAATLALDGLELHDAVGRIAALSGTIAPDAYTVVALTSSKLNNDGDTVVLMAGATALDQVRYGDDALPAPASGVALARTADGWLATTTPTPGAANVITSPPEPTRATKKEQVGPDQTIKAGSVLINEVAPRATDGDDWIELANRTDRRLDLTGWKIIIGASSDVPLSGHVSAKSRVLVRLADDALPDNGILFLVASGDMTLDQVSYGAYQDGNDADNAPAPPADGSVARYEGQDTDVDSADFYLPRTPTPDRANIASEDEPVVASATRAIIIPACILPEDPQIATVTGAALTTAKKSAATTKKTPTKTAAKKSTSAKSAAQDVALADIGDVEDKSLVRTEGTVVGAPVPVSGRVWYIADGDGGAKIQLTGKPLALVPGDRVRITATLAWLVAGPTLKAASAAVERLPGTASSTPTDRPISELTADDAHRYVRVRGEVVDRRGERITVEDGVGRLAIALPAGIAAQSGDTVQAAGVYESGDPGRLLVFAPADVTVSQVPTAIPGGSPKQTSSRQRDSPWPLVGALATLAAGGLLLLRRHRQTVVHSSDPSLV